MISIRCSELESIRKNPSAYGQLLASGENQGGGTYGMFACFQDVARKVHLGDLNPTDGVKDLYNKFDRFNDNPFNKARQEKLISQFVNYCRVFEKKEFVFIEGAKNIKWEFPEDTRLTGRTPWVVANADGYYSFQLLEKDLVWSQQLKFPLFQQYLAEHIIDCGLAEVNVGVYSLQKGAFEFTCFSKKEVENAIEETTVIFSKVQHEYSKLKK